MSEEKNTEGNLFLLKTNFWLIIIFKMIALIYYFKMYILRKNKKINTEIVALKY